MQIIFVYFVPVSLSTSSRRLDVQKVGGILNLEYALGPGCSAEQAL
jgi:hypothetical protein